MSQKFPYAHIALNVPIDSLFTYKIPEHFSSQIQPGARVIVNFGNKILTGVVVELSDKEPLRKVKDIRDVLDDKPILAEEMISFCRWVSQYYISPIGEVVFLSIPRNINIKSVSYTHLDVYKRQL